MEKNSIAFLGYSFKIEILILIGVLYLIIFGHTMCSCAKLDLTEEFNTLNYFVGKKNWRKTPEGFTNNGQPSKFNINNDKPINTSSWFSPNLTITPGQSPSSGANSILSRPSQPVPLTKGEMLMFANTEFKPDCCPNSYSNSSGCACMTSNQYNYLVTRGSNNIPYSEY